MLDPCCHNLVRVSSFRVLLLEPKAILTNAPCLELSSWRTATPLSGAVSGTLMPKASDLPSMPTEADTTPWSERILPSASGSGNVRAQCPLTSPHMGPPWTPLAGVNPPLSSPTQTAISLATLTLTTSLSIWLFVVNGLVLLTFTPLLDAHPLALVNKLCSCWNTRCFWWLPFFRLRQQ